MNSTNVMNLDIAKVVKAKAPNTNVPTFIINYLRRIAHETEINQLFKTNAGLKNLDFIRGSLDILQVSTEVQGKENLPKGGKYIFVSNHPLGGLDGITLGYLIGKEYDGKVRLLANDLLMNIEPLQEIFIPVNKTGAQGKKNAAITQAMFESDNHLITFPAGICSRKIKGKVMDLEWKKNFVTKAVEHQRDVVPIFFEGKNSNFFYNLANLRKFLGIKFNIEMLFLSDELFKQKGNKFTIKIGKPIPWQTFDRTKTHTQWAAWVKSKVYEIK